MIPYCLYLVVKDKHNNSYGITPCFIVINYGVTNYILILPEHYRFTFTQSLKVNAI